MKASSYFPFYYTKLNKFCSGSTSIYNISGLILLKFNKDTKSTGVNRSKCILLLLGWSLLCLPKMPRVCALTYQFVYVVSHCFLTTLPVQIALLSGGPLTKELNYLSPENLLSLQHLALYCSPIILGIALTKF